MYLLVLLSKESCTRNNHICYEVVYGSPNGRPEKFCLFILPWSALRRTGLVLKRTVVILSWVALKRTWTRRFGQVDCPSSGSGAMLAVRSYYTALCGRGGDHPDVECSSGAVADAGEVACVGDGCCRRGIQMLLMWSPGSCGTVSWRWISMASLTLRVFQLLMEVMSWVSSHMMRCSCCCACLTMADFSHSLSLKLVLCSLSRVSMSLPVSPM